jgi:hypothetical protein
MDVTPPVRLISAQGRANAAKEVTRMTQRDAFAGRAVAGFLLGVLCILALLTAYSFGIRRWPPGLEGPGSILYVSTFPVALVGILLSGWGRFSTTRRGLAIAGFVLSLAAALSVIVFFIVAVIALSQVHYSLAA